MEKGQLEMIDKIMKVEIEQNARLLDYWKEFSTFSNWQVWIVLAMLVVPLIILLLFIDRRKAFQLGFYGYSVHVFFAYTDIMGTERGIWFYPYKILPFLPSNFTLDASLVPVIYILFYQWTLNKSKNYYIWMIPLCLVLAFLMKPLMVGLGLFYFREKENFFLLFLGYVFVALISKFLTEFFILLGKTTKWSLNNK
ncbi:CBO0543 family protein [Bacillus dakarensis]|uniref:CBO0543 family protein n=1 Tax=Robertmurraya dakarensis TaxID=1926278 RepID=UPI000981FDE1|nr:CBO0543 family protein [Bacillus dakarensis]